MAALVGMAPAGPGMTPTRPGATRSSPSDPCGFSGAPPPVGRRLRPRTGSARARRRAKLRRAKFPTGMTGLAGPKLRPRLSVWAGMIHTNASWRRGVATPQLRRETWRGRGSERGCGRLGACAGTRALVREVRLRWLRGGGDDPWCAGRGSAPRLGGARVRTRRFVITIARIGPSTSHGGGDDRREGKCGDTVAGWSLAAGGMALPASLRLDRRGRPIICARRLATGPGGAEGTRAPRVCRDGSADRDLGKKAAIAPAGLG